MDEPETTTITNPPKRKPGRPAKAKVAKKHQVPTEKVEGKIRKNAKISSIAELHMEGSPERKQGEDEVSYLERLLEWKKAETKKTRDAEAKELTAKTDHNGRVVTHPKQGPWNVALAREVYINTVSHMGNRVSLSLGMLPTIEVIRGRKVIIPQDAFSVLQDTLTKRETHDMTVSPPERMTGDNGTEYTNYPFQDYGQRSWDEYIAFRDAEAKKPYTSAVRRSIL